MSTLVSLTILLHFVVAGLLLERRIHFFSTKVLAGVFVYFFAAHVVAGYVLKAAPWLVDPR